MGSLGEFLRKLPLLTLVSIVDSIYIVKRVGW